MTHYFSHVSTAFQVWRLHPQQDSYVAGALLGGSQGLVAAARVRPEIGPDTARLRVNRLLNMTGTRGRTAGNALGVLGLLFAGIESGLGYLNDGSVPDSAATVSAGDNCSFWPGYHTMYLAPSASTRQYLLLQALVLEHCSDLLVVLGLQPLQDQLVHWRQQALSLLDKRCHRIFSEANHKHSPCWQIVSLCSP